MKKEDLVRGLSFAQSKVKKVLPISHEPTSSLSSLTIADHQVDQSDKLCKGDNKTKLVMLRMKELIRRAAAAANTQKAGKYIGQKVLIFRSKGSFKGAARDDDQYLSRDSPMISLRWDIDAAESCSTPTSLPVCPAMTATTNSTPLHDVDQYLWRKGYWITTDSEFVVLEL
ncbi:hypothetical protein Dimus_016561 [Dionaea muscipula]